MRLIDADALKSYIDNCQCCKHCRQSAFMCQEDCELPDYLTPQWNRVIDEQPTVDPVKHGRWILEWETEDTRMLRCSECRMVFNVGKGRDGNFCPNCGAKMDGEEDIIRCKDCKWFTGKWCTRMSYKLYDERDVLVSPMHSCSFAERKEE